MDNAAGQGYSGWSDFGSGYTQDRIFLLSYAEANEYLGLQDTYISGATRNKQSRMAPTAYARTRGAYITSSYTTIDGESSGSWWLRSHGADSGYAALVYSDGSLYSNTMLNSSACVRPAFWIDLETAENILCDGYR